MAQAVAPDAAGDGCGGVDMAGRRRVETWVHICNEIIHDVLPSRTRTVHLLWVVTLPPAILGGFFTVLFTVLIPDPRGWLGVLGCSTGVMVTTRLRRWLKSRALSAVSDSPTPGEPPAGESAPTTPQPP